jgi:Concanavalin A-like lectin/glucanases superfamily
MRIPEGECGRKVALIAVQGTGDWYSPFLSPVMTGLQNSTVDVLVTNKVNSLKLNLVGIGGDDPNLHVYPWTGTKLSLNLTRFSAMTWVFWMNPANISSTRGILDKYTSSANREWRIYLMAGGELRLSIANGTKGYQERNTIKFKPALNVWTHVAIVYNAGAFNVYKNGVLVSTFGNFTSPYTSIQNTTTKVRIGLRQAGGEHFSGKLDEVRIYNCALSVAEILALKDY